MRLDVSRALAAEGKEIPFDARISLPELSMFGETVHFDDAASLSGIYVSMGTAITVRGALSFVARAECSLCLKPVMETFFVPVEAEYALSPDANNPDIYAYDGAGIDLSVMAEEAVSLALPIQWRCAEGCKGLCPVCGADRNQTNCACRMEGGKTNPFTVLLRDDE